MLKTDALVLTQIALKSGVQVKFITTSWSRDQIAINIEKTKSLGLLYSTKI